MTSGITSLFTIVKKELSASELIIWMTSINKSGTIKNMGSLEDIFSVKVLILFINNDNITNIIGKDRIPKLSIPSPINPKTLLFLNRHH